MGPTYLIIEIPFPKTWTQLHNESSIEKVPDSNIRGSKIFYSYTYARGNIFSNALIVN